MPHQAQTQFDLADTVTVYVLAADGVLIDVIEEVDLGDPVEASREDRVSLKEAALWAYLASKEYERRRGSGPTPARPA